MSTHGHRIPHEKHGCKRLRYLPNTTTPWTAYIREHSRKGWIIRPINDQDDRDELDHVDLENLMDVLADQESCRIVGGVPITANHEPAQIGLF